MMNEYGAEVEWHRRGETEVLEQQCVPEKSHCVVHSLALKCLGLKPALRGEDLAASRLSHDTTF